MSTSTVGVFSSDRMILHEAIDDKSRVAHIFRTTVADLSDQMGGSPTPAQLLIIQSAALKACRLYLISEKFLNSSDYDTLVGNNKALAWLNSMRLDLVALGLERKAPKDVTPKLGDILRAHKDRDE